MERFWSKIDKTNSCWVWTGTTAGGGVNGRYGRFRLQGRMVLCPSLRLRTSCRPDPRRAPDRPPLLAAREVKLEYCPYGHPLSGENVYRQPSRPRTRRCRAYQAARQRAKRTEKKLQPSP